MLLKEKIVEILRELYLFLDLSDISFGINIHLDVRDACENDVKRALKQTYLMVVSKS